MEMVKTRINNSKNNGALKIILINSGIDNKNFKSTV